MNTGTSTAMSMVMNTDAAVHAGTYTATDAAAGMTTAARTGKTSF